MPDNPQDPQTTQDQQDTSAQPFMNFFPGQQTQATPQTDPSEQLKAMFGPSGDKVPLEHNDAATNLATGLKKALTPNPIDSQSLHDFNFEFTHKFEPERTSDGRIALNPDGSPIYKKKLDATGNPIIDPKTGQPVLEQSTLYASPARRLLQGFLTNALTLGAPAIQGHPDVVRELKKEQFNTERQVALQTAYKNAQTNIQYMRQQQINLRQQNQIDFKQKLANQKEADFQQEFGFKKTAWQAADKLRSQHLDLQNKEFNNQVLNAKEKAFKDAYGPAFDMAQADFIQNNPGKTLEDAVSDPRTLVKAHEYYNILKPQMEYSKAVQTMLLNGEITEADMGNQARIFKAAQSSPSLKDDEKASVTAFLQNPLASQANRLAQIALQNQGRIAMMSVPRPQTGLVPDENNPGQLKPISVQAGGPNVPATMTTLPAVGQANTLTPTTKGQVEQADLVQTSGKHLQDVIDVLDQKGKTGNFTAIWKNLFNNSPLADPDVKYLRAAIMSFADLNPKLHNFRGATIGKEFEKVLGGPPTNAQALKAGVQALVDQARIISGSTPVGFRTPGQTSAPAQSAVPKTTFEFDAKGNLVKAPAKKGK